MEEINNYIEKLFSSWHSPFIPRKSVSEATGGLYSEGYMANLDSRGEGPEFFYIGRQVVYPIEPFVEWLKGRSS